jgi:hypothetical protein
MPHLEIHPLGWLWIGAIVVVGAIGLMGWCLCVVAKDPYEGESHDLELQNR